MKVASLSRVASRERMHPCARSGDLGDGSTTVPRHVPRTAVACNAKRCTLYAPGALAPRRPKMSAASRPPRPWSPSEPRPHAASSTGGGGGGHGERPRRLHGRRSPIRGRRNRQVRPSRFAGARLTGEVIHDRHRHAQEIGDLAGGRLIPSSQTHPRRTTGGGVRQAGFHGGFESRTICPRERRFSRYAQTEEVSEGAGRPRCAVGVGVRPAGRARR
jgi:hypothetical protein